MKRTIKTTIEKEIEITFPFYATDGLHYFRMDEDGCIQVKHHNNLFTSIDFMINYPEIWLDYTQCSEDDFLSAYANAQSELTVRYHDLFSKNNQFIKNISDEEV